VDRCGSVIYLDPQVIEAKEPRNTPLDIWSLGVMIYELFERKEAYSDQGFVQFWEIARYIVDEQQTNVITVPDEINLEGKEAKIISKQAEKASVLLTWCCQFQRSARPAAHELVTELSTGPEVISDNLAMKIKRV
jgi:serine/threonine protein kinase